MIDVRCIDADALIDIFEDRLAKVSARYGVNSAVAGAVAGAMGLIEAQPTIEPERKTGKWIRTGRENVYGGYEVECSECGDAVMITHVEDELYCRHCGARMTEEGEQK